jgi:uncharacterized membrane protein
VHIDGWQVITRMAIEFICLVWQTNGLFHHIYLLITFFIGFSRGAYQVRVLAGMIHKVSDCNVFINHSRAE